MKNNKIKFLCENCYVVSNLKYKRTLKCPVCGNKIFAKKMKGGRNK